MVIKTFDINFVKISFSIIENINRHFNVSLFNFRN